MTGCAKFFIFLLFAAPIAYIGASYYYGNDPIADIQNMIGSNSENVTSERTAELPKSNNELIDLKSTVRELQQEVGRLQYQLEQKDLEIQFLKDQKTAN